MLGVVAHVGDRNLVRAEGAFDLLAVDLARSGPALGRAQHERRPAWPSVNAAFLARGLLNAADACQALIEHRGQSSVDREQLVAGHEVRFVAVTGQQLGDVHVAGAAEHGRPGDLVAVQMQNRQHRTVVDRVQKADAFPAAFERSGLGLAIAHDGGHDQVRVVEGGPERVREHVTELAAFVNGAWRVGAGVAGDAARRRELAEQAPQAGLVTRDVRVDFGVRALQVGIGDHRRPAVPGASHEQHVQVVAHDDAVQVRAQQVQAG